MPILMPDTSEMEDLAPSQPATYRAQIIKADSQKSKVKEGGKGGNDMLVPYFKFDAPALSDGVTRTVTRRTFLNVTGAGSFGFDQLLRCLGYTELADKIKANPGKVPFDTDIVVNKAVNVILVNDPYEGKITDKIASFLPA